MPSGLDTSLAPNGAQAPAFDSAPRPSDGSRRPRFKRPSNRWLLRAGAILLVLIVAIVAFIAWFDWNRMRGPIGRFASARLHRTVAIDGDLKVHLLTWSPTATIDRLRVAQPSWAGPGQMVTIERSIVSIRLPQLLKGDVFLPVIELQKPRFVFIRDAQGQSNWTFSKEPSPKPAKLPPIGRFEINDGQVSYSDYKNKQFVRGLLEARERRNGPYSQGFLLDGKGSVNGNAFLLKVTGGPMINVDKDRPYPFDADVRAGGTRIVAKGQINKPFDFGGITTSLRISGPDMADLFYLTGLTLPNTPPYNISGRLDREGTLYRFEKIEGKVGDTDLAGQIRVETKTRRPDVTADLRSRMLDMDDLATIFGGAPDATETISPGQAAIAKTMAADQRLLPDATLAVDRIRSMDATFKYRAASVRSELFPVRKAALDLTLKGGVLDIDHFAFDLTTGQVDGSAKIDARKATPVTDFDARMRGVSVQQFIKTAGPPPITAVVQARAKLHGAGNSVRTAMSNADGSITAVIPNGEIRQAFAELLGPNVGKGLSLLMAKDPKGTELRCAVADFRVTNGVARANTVVLDTGVVVAHGKGTIDLNTEHLDLRLDGDSKQPRLLKLWTPITVKGTLRAPKPGVDAASLAAQGGVATGLAVLLTPLAAILPFVDPGLAKDQNCAGLIASAGAKGAPVKAAAR